jgi:hypothetical protein
MKTKDKEKSNQPHVSEFSISESLTFATKYNSYFIFLYDSIRQILTLRDDLPI